MKNITEANLIDEDSPRELHLAQTHLALGATMRNEERWIVPASYGDPHSEYAAVRNGGAGLFDLSSRGRLEVWGSEAVQFLNGTVTNDVEKLQSGQWIEAAFPTVQGRLIARVGEKLLIESEAVASGTVKKLLERFTFAGDFFVRDLTQETVALSLQGAGSEQVLSRICTAANAIERNGVSSAKLKDKDVTIWRGTHTGEEGFDLVTTAKTASVLWDELVAAGARPSGFDALETLRVEAGIPRFGIDATEASVVLEVVDETAAVSYTKKCYIGQEIIARVHWRGHVAKKLVGLQFERVVALTGGSVVLAAESDRDIGRVTSSVFSPRLATTIALGTVKYDFIKPGTDVQIVAADGTRAGARVAELPMVRGSWYSNHPESRAAEAQS